MFRHASPTSVAQRLKKVQTLEGVVVDVRLLQLADAGDEEVEEGAIVETGSWVRKKLVGYS